MHKRILQISDQNRLPAGMFVNLLIINYSIVMIWLFKSLTLRITVWTARSLHWPLCSVRMLTD